MSFDSRTDAPCELGRRKAAALSLAFPEATIRSTVQALRELAALPLTKHNVAGIAGLEIHCSLCARAWWEREMPLHASDCTAGSALRLADEWDSWGASGASSDLRIEYGRGVSLDHHQAAAMAHAVNPFPLRIVEVPAHE